MAKRSAVEIRQFESDAAALDLRRQGLSYTQIADRLGCSVSTAHARVRRCFDTLAADRDEAAALVIGLELERLDAMLRGVYGLACTGDTAAIDRCLKISERRMKILGLEAQKLEMSGPNGAPIEVDNSAYERIKERLARYRENLVEGGAPQLSA